MELVKIINKIHVLACRDYTDGDPPNNEGISITSYGGILSRVKTMSKKGGIWDLTPWLKFIDVSNKYF